MLCYCQSVCIWVCFSPFHQALDALVICFRESEMGMGANSEDIAEIESGNLFEQIEDIIEFPPEDSGNSAMSCNDGKDILSLWDNVLPECYPLFPDNNAGLGFSADHLSLPYEDIAQLEWLSAFVEDSFSGGGSSLGSEHFCSNKDVQISSPVSVLESSTSSSCCSGEKIATTLSPTHRGLQRARSKRPRPAAFNPRPEILLISENLANSKWKIPKPAKVESKKKMKTKTTSSADQGVDDQNPPVRKCLHCEITKTPQWRAGPLGPKTLCNACGVRYKSGRLFPEYRPAASPTFVPSVHSNSHKKVLEMRTNVDARTAGISESSEIESNS